MSSSLQRQPACRAFGKVGAARCPVCGFELRDELARQVQTANVFCPRPFCGVELKRAESGRLQALTFRLVDHFSRCVLPFSFSDQDGVDVYAQLRHSRAWSLQVYSPENADDLDRMEYFLPYIRRFLFPSPHEPEASCERWRFDLEWLGKTGTDVLPFTLDCRDSRKKLSHTLPLLLDRVELLVFSYQVGFLTLQFRAASTDASYFDQMNALNFLRPIAPLYLGFELPLLRSEAAAYRMPQLLAYLLAEFGTSARPADGPAGLPERPVLPVQPIYDDRMMVYTFSCVDRASCLPDPERCQKLLARATVIDFDPLEVAKAPVDAGEESGAAWQRCRWQSFGKDGGGLVVFNTDPFHERFLGGYQGTYYYDIFLLATLQRVTLLTLFERLSDISARASAQRQNQRRLRRLRRDLLLFKNQCCFSQITNRERGLSLWKRWHAVFENRTLLEEVNDQAEELDTFLKNQTRERIEWLVRLGGFLATAVPAVWGLEILLPPAQWGEWITTARWVLLATLIAGTGLFASVVLFRNQD